MSYFRKPLGEVDCNETPDDEVCKAFYAKPESAPAPSGNLFSDFFDKMKDAVSSVTGSAPAMTTATVTRPVASQSSIMPIVVVGGAVALWMFLRKK